VNESHVRNLVRKVVYRTLGKPTAPIAPAKRRLVTEADIQVLSFGQPYDVPAGSIITPLARQIAMERHISLREGSPAANPMTPSPGTSLGSATATSEKTVAIGADHGGYELKQILSRSLNAWGFAVIDCGTQGPDSVDYPDFALAVAQLVAQGSAWRGVMIDGAGIGSCMAANKVPGIRAAMCYDQATAVNSREHNDANLLTLGAGLIGPALAQQILRTWLDTPFGGGRHARRVDKIMAIEERFRGGR
jgi:ribose 5-phosphate isomerase B